MYFNVDIEVLNFFASFSMARRADTMRDGIGLGQTTGLREYLSSGYGLRFSTDIYGSKREKTVFYEYLQQRCFFLTEISESLRRPPGVYRRM